MADESQVMSIKQRIAALKHAQAGQTGGAEASEPTLIQPTPSPIRPAAPPKPRTFNLCNDNDAAGSNGWTHNQSPPPTYDESFPRPIVPRPSPTPAPAKFKSPPPLPVRKPSDQQAVQQRPALPPRRPTNPSRKVSRESMASDISRSTTTSTGRATITSVASSDSGTGRSLPPAWGEVELPPLPPKRQAQLPSRPSATSMKSNSSLSVPRLPARRGSTQSNCSTDSIGSQQPRPPPRLPSRISSDRSPSTNGDASTESRPTLPTRRLPPPPPSTAALGKLQQAGFAGITKNSPPVETSGAPPPVPLASRPPPPDLSRLQASKPRLPATSSPAVTPTVTPTVACLKCRDFSAPDAHAARYPRATLPTHDLGWLARELTAPFPSPTDKARVIFTWMHHNIDYDVDAFYGNNLQPSTPASTLASGLAVCEGYARLFQVLATQAGLECRVIHGHGKGTGYSDPVPGSALPPFDGNHEWNVVQIDNGQWKLIDACWGAGCVQGPGQPYRRQFNPTKFTETNDEFGLRHFPSNANEFYRDDGRSGITWEEYILGNPASPLWAEQPVIFAHAEQHSIGARTYRPAAKEIAVQQGGPLRFQFELICEHWTLEHHSRAQPGLFLLVVHGADGRQDDRLVFTHYRGTNPGGGGDLWYVDVPDVRTLGTPGQTVQVVVLTRFGDRTDPRGVPLTAEEYWRRVNQVAMSWAGIAEWRLV
ncbi:uncharacterized protein BO97DRAFT_405198 [Aspergillus homomorphus CBS 101889]|uniref:Transglutaminase-like domain-containing protein n=1 Tax=Aspergillus homomorphus (strain CBS 101889) TaxID=1450537 RepID=A0A395HYV2_ASPHC|nr:hypothetical protein BO97DRAFT_405198 [Aspergillus homomorphus CBS 101889]RAL12980.1 hypothetical protein BO97DRAFT_405198 [Aspergillus homomorphus CBS 101889]